MCYAYVYVYQKRCDTHNSDPHYGLRRSGLFVNILFSKSEIKN